MDYLPFIVLKRSPNRFLSCFYSRLSVYRTSFFIKGAEKWQFLLQNQQILKYFYRTFRKKDFFLIMSHISYPG